jgi:hypothetical protein
MTHRKFFSALLLSTTLLFNSACSTVGRSPADAPSPDPVVTAPVKADTIDRAKLRAALASRRAASVDHFLAYRDARVYPVNTYQPGMQHVWLDEQGNLCAAATLISHDWGRDAAMAVSFDDNFIRLADVEDGPLLDWILTSGLTHHEIVAIQEPGFAGREMPIEPQPDDPGRIAEIDRLFTVYNSVERQLRSMSDASLDDATDALMARPDLAKRFLDGEIPGAGHYLALL